MQIEQQLSQINIPPRATRLTAAVGAGAMAVGAVLVAYFDPGRSTFFPVCPLFSLTGFACPGCGLTRGFHELFHGRVIPALDFNFLIPVWAVVGGYVFVSLVLHTARGRGLPMWPTWPKLLWVFAIMLLGFGVLRNIPAWPFTILYP
jgi:hypothetical protein